MFGFNGSRDLAIADTSGIGTSKAQVFDALRASDFVASGSREKIEAALRLLGAKLAGAAVGVTNPESTESFFAANDYIGVTVAQARVNSHAPFRVCKPQGDESPKFFGTYRMARADRFGPSSTLTLITDTHGTRPGRNGALHGRHRCPPRGPDAEASAGVHVGSRECGFAYA